MKELVSKKIFDKTHIPGHHLYHSYFLTQLTKKVTYMHVFQSTHRRVLGVFFSSATKNCHYCIWQKFREIQKYKSISRNFLPLLPEFCFHFFSGALWCVTWWRRKYHLFFTVLLHLSHRTSPPIVCIFKICCKKSNVFSITNYFENKTAVFVS